jgi:hypothetical protein
LFPKNVKAYWRRATAYEKLGKNQLAKADLEYCLVIEPTNVAAKKDLIDLKMKMNPSTSVKKQIIESKGLLVNIEEIDGTEDEEMEKFILFGKESIDSKISSFQEIKPQVVQEPVIEEIKPQKPLIQEIEPEKIQSTLPINNINTNTNVKIKEPKLNIPNNLFDFEKDWKSYQKNSNILYKYLQNIPPERLPIIFKSSLDGDYFSQILKIIQTHYLVKETAEKTLETMYNLTKTNRFEMTLMFMDKSEKQLVNDIINWLQENQTLLDIDRLKLVCKKFK